MEDSAPASALVRKFVQPISLAMRRRAFNNSGEYWQQRYESGGDSGAGSYGEHALFKASVLNEFVRNQAVESVIEFGCGDGHQLSLAKYPNYVGLDVAPSAIDRCKQTFADDRTKSFFIYSPPHFIDRANVFHAELSLSLDVIYHLVEDEIFNDYMRHLFDAASRFVVIYSSDDSSIIDRAPHVRHRRFSAWVKENQPSWSLAKTVNNPINDRAGSVVHFAMYARKI